MLAIIAVLQMFGGRLETGIRNIGDCVLQAATGNFSACGGGGTPSAPAAGAKPPTPPAAMAPPGPTAPAAPAAPPPQTWTQWAWNGVKNGAQWAWNGSFGPIVQDVRNTWNSVSNWWTTTGRPWVVWAWNGSKPTLVWVWNGTRWLLWDNEAAQWVWSPVTQWWTGVKNDWNWVKNQWNQWRNDPRSWGQYIWDGTKWVAVSTWQEVKDILYNNPRDFIVGSWQFVKGAWAWVTSSPQPAAPPTPPAGPPIGAPPPGGRL